ncbi:hypothetical protein BCR33DRAFT_169796 [Rhizoclosmatium globosum]|uniref:Uncharacterized protein n=1 Tax=Rhizoclosmatium globosum TaxID=329046 RepID=A0A1Y2CEQ6_9FUNG|nr:hypothetical protein BCR33DRAFT_169796 [Rhizoclosmatium globosum]|eukprot:ORY45533.1 hypothetical protein BCR33DRAFT_169796 [Rhizoclosmatium globosum]
MYSTPTLLSTSRASFITLTEIVQAANQMLLHVDTLSAPNCDIARTQLLSIPSLSLKPESVDPICNSFLALCDYVVDLEVSRTAPDPAVTGKLLIDLTMAKYRVLDMCKYGEERKRALDVMSDLRFDMNRQYKPSNYRPCSCWTQIHRSLTTDNTHVAR